MTRGEQIEEASVAYQISKCPNAIGGDAFADLIYKANINPSFIAGAEWADKTTIEKACNWLQAELAFYHRYHNVSDIDMDSLIKDFRKAMEE